MTLAPMRHIVSCTFNSITVFCSSLLTFPSQKTQNFKIERKTAIGTIPSLLYQVLDTQKKAFCTLTQCEPWHGEIMSVWGCPCYAVVTYNLPKGRYKVCILTDNDRQRLQNKESCIIAAGFNFFFKQVFFIMITFFLTFIYLVSSSIK